ncbi:MAG: hypothetical protein ACLQKA_04185 [Bryobacteraceae bacterium]
MAARMQSRRQQAAALRSNPLYIDKQERDLVLRARPGLCTYPVCWVLLLFTTSFAKDHPAVFWLSAIAGLATVAIWVWLCERRLAGRHYSHWRRWFSGLAVSMGLNWGLVFAATIVFYRYPGWVKLGGYATMPWRDIIDFWKHLNQSLAVVLDGIPVERLTASCQIGNHGPVTVEILIGDYFAHMQHHLDHIFSARQRRV